MKIRKMDACTRIDNLCREIKHIMTECKINKEVVIEDFIYLMECEFIEEKDEDN